MAGSNLKSPTKVRSGAVIELPPQRNAAGGRDSLQTHVFAHGLGRTPTAVFAKLRARVDMAAGIKRGTEKQVAYASYGFRCTIYATATEVIIHYRVPDVEMPDGSALTLPFAAGEWEFVVAVMG